MATVDRATLRWAGMSARGQIISAGIPTTAARGGAIAAPIDLADSTITDRINTADESYQKLVIPSSGGRGDVQAIAIAPDSTIAECDIAILGEDGEQRRHRISPGNPLVADLRDVDHALVSIPDSFPLIVQTNEDAFIDGEVILDDSGLGGPLIGFPLRLELWRSQSPARTFRRAALVGHALIDTDNAGASSPAFLRQIWIPTSGRRRLRVAVFCESFGVNTVTFTASAVFPYKVTGQRTDGNVQENLPLDTAGSTSLALDAGVHLFEISALQSTVVVLGFSAGAVIAGGRIQVRVRAEDD